MPTAPVWYWVRIDGDEPEVFQLVDGILWDFGLKWGIGSLDKSEVWSDPIHPPVEDEIFGFMEGKGRILGDIENTIPASDWDTPMNITKEDYTRPL